MSVKISSMSPKVKLASTRKRSKKSSENRLLSVFIGSWYGLAIVLVSTFIIGVVLLTTTSWKSLQKLILLQQSSPISWQELRLITQMALTTEPEWRNKTMLVLGTDELSTRGNQQVLTDTILVVGFNPFNASITLLPIPRDVWVDSENSKINALYAKTLQDSPASALQTTESTFEKILNIPIDQSLVVSMSVVQDLIDAVDGVTIDVPVAFTDTAFPRMDVDVTTETDPSVLYETISFERGLTHLDGTTALKYMRSRHSPGAEGNDMARSRRQQQVIVALIEKIKQAVTDRSYVTLIQLLRVYKTHLNSQLSLPDAAQMIVSLPGNPAEYTFNSAAVPILPASVSGVLQHPNQHKSGQWVFVMTSLSDFQQAVQEKLGVTPGKQP